MFECSRWCVYVLVNLFFPHRYVLNVCTASELNKQANFAVQELLWLCEYGLTPGINTPVRYC